LRSQDAAAEMGHAEWLGLLIHCPAGDLKDR